MGVKMLIKELKDKARDIMFKTYRGDYPEIDQIVEMVAREVCEELEFKIEEGHQTPQEMLANQMKFRDLFKMVNHRINKILSQLKELEA